MPSLEEIKEKIREFNIERDGDKFHNPKDLLIALTSEVGELAECYRWLNEEELQRVHSDPEKKKKIEAEIADIMSYILMICYKTNIDLLDVLDKKINLNILLISLREFIAIL